MLPFSNIIEYPYSVTQQPPKGSLVGSHWYCDIINCILFQIFLQNVWEVTDIVVVKKTWKRSLLGVQIQMKHIARLDMIHFEKLVFQIALSLNGKKM